MQVETGPGDNQDSGAELKGFSVVKEGDAVVKISTRDCRDVQRWKLMPPMDEYAATVSLDLHKSRYLTKMHPSVGNMSNLRELLLTRCEQLESLPSSIGNLLQLEVLDMMDCSQMKELPDSIGNLKRYVAADVLFVDCIKVSMLEHFC